MIASLTRTSQCTVLLWQPTSCLSLFSKPVHKPGALHVGYYSSIIMIIIITRFHVFLYVFVKCVARSSASMLPPIFLGQVCLAYQLDLTCRGALREQARAALYYFLNDLQRAEH